MPVARANECYGRKRADLYTDCGVARRDSGFALIQAFSRLGAFRAGKREHERAEPRRVRPIFGFTIARPTKCVEGLLLCNRCVLPYRQPCRQRAMIKPI